MCDCTSPVTAGRQACAQCDIQRTENSWHIFARKFVCSVRNEHAGFAHSSITDHHQFAMQAGVRHCYVFRVFFIYFLFSAG